VEDLLRRRVDECPMHRQRRDEKVFAFPMQTVGNPGCREVRGLVAPGEELLVDQPDPKDATLYIDAPRKQRHPLPGNGQTLCRLADFGCQRIQRRRHF
jgi:hypothetical protein